MSYIVKNCPAYEYNEEWNHHICKRNLAVYETTCDTCPECSDCTMKQIVENLRQVAYACHCDSCDGSGYYNGCGDTECGTYQALKSMELLDIQEVE
jgi:hypothetical protein